MAARRSRVLLVAGETREGRRIAAVLGRSPATIEVTRVARPAQVATLRRRSFAVAVLLLEPGQSERKAAGELTAQLPRVPIITVHAEEATNPPARSMACGVQARLPYRCALCPSASHLCSSVAWVAAESRRTRRRLQAARRDPLTGLPDRGAFHERLQEFLARGEREGRGFAVMFVDLDGLKAVNDRHGHEAGDHLLRHVARRLRSCLRVNDLAARQGGDEFTLLVDDVEGPSGAAHVADRILRETARALPLRHRLLRCTASVGISLFPRDGRAAATLLRRADRAMYRAKAAGGNCFVLHRAGEAVGSRSRWPRTGRPGTAARGSARGAAR